jgi:hypothetical protein
MAIGRFLKAARPAPRKPAPIKPALKKPTPVNSGLVSKKDPFFKSKEYKSFQEQQRGRPATMDMYKSPYFGDVGSGSFGREQDEAYRKFKNIPDPTPRMISPGPTPPSRPDTGMPPTDMSRTILPGPPSGGATGSSFIDSLKSAPSGGATGNPTGIIGGTGARADFGMKKGGSVKASKAPKASSASKRGDGIATKGKTKGRFV